MTTPETPAHRPRIMLVANLRKGGNSADWIATFEAMGYEIVPFYMLAYRASGGRVARSLGTRLNRGPAVARLNRDLVAFARDHPYDLAFVFKGTWVRPETVEQLKRNAGSGHAVHLVIDSLFTDNRSHHFFRSLPLYRLAFTDKRFEVADYEAAGAQEVSLFTQGYGRRFATACAPARPPPPFPPMCASSAIASATMPSVSQRLRSVGWIWNMGPGLAGGRTQGPAWMDSAVRGDGLWGTAYPATMAAARIGLGLLDKRVPEEATTRSVEIPAAGALLSPNAPPSTWSCSGRGSKLTISTLTRR